MKSHLTVLLLASLSLSTAAAAQTRNPFQPAAPGSGLSKAEVQRIVAEEAAKKNGAAAPGGAGTPSGSPVAPGTGAIPSQPGGIAPPAAMISSEPAVPEESAVDKFFEAGGIFVGCVGSKPMFATKGGKRVYFTSKDLRKSNEARHLVRC